MERVIFVAGVTFALAAGAGLPFPPGVTEALPQASAAKPSQPAATKPSKAPPAKAASAVPSAAELDKLVAPVALYPDALLGQILLCATNVGRVGTLSEWLQSQDALKGTELQDAAQRAGFDASFVALAVFPDVVNDMASQLEWTAALGQAFTADRSAVFASIQRLRAKARAAGTLKSSPQQDVETRTTSSGQEVIVIEPANPQVVYVPQYNPQVVYTQPTSSTVVIKEESNSDAAVAGLIGFTAGIAIGAAIDNNYYYGPYGWYGGGYMYDDAWDDYYDAREDAREDWQDHREDLAEERGDRAEERGERTGSAQEQRTERQQTRQENRPTSQAERQERRDTASANAQQRSAGTSSAESRGYSGDGSQRTRERSGSSSDAFSNYSSGRSERAASSRGQRSRSGGSRSGSRGGGRRR
jgi:hypothetical protein